jgi:hypothetical protein
MQDARYKMQDARCKMEDGGLKIEEKYVYKNPEGMKLL